MVTSKPDFGPPTGCSFCLDAGLKASLWLRNLYDEASDIGPHQTHYSETVPEKVLLTE